MGILSVAQTSFNFLGKIRLPVVDMTALCLRSIRCMYDTTEKGEELIFTLHCQCHQCPCGGVQLQFSCSKTSGMGNISLLRLSLFLGCMPSFGKIHLFILWILQRMREKKGKWARFPPDHSCTIRTAACSRLRTTNLIFL